MQKSQILAWLIIHEGTSKEIHHEITQSETMIGRGSECDLSLDDPLASRQHALIRLRDEIEIEDLNSRNGTFVNDQQVKTGLLMDGDFIQIGNTILVMRLPQNLGRNDAHSELSKEIDDLYKQTIPHQHDSVECLSCKMVNPSGGEFCIHCGNPLPQLPIAFQNVLRAYKDLNQSYRTGEISSEDYQDLLTALVVQDDQERYWMLGAESGMWYRKEGNKWQSKSPPLILSGQEKKYQPAPPGVLLPEQTQAKKSQQPQKRNGVNSLWLISALLVIAVILYIVIEFDSLDQLSEPGEPTSQSFEEENQLQSNILSSKTTENPSMSVTLAPTGSTLEIDQLIRPYNPTQDQSLPSFTADAVLLPEKSTGEHFFYENHFFSGTSGYLRMTWCAIDQSTLENNIAELQFEGSLNGSPIPDSAWTQENISSGDKYCRRYRVVLENLDSGIYQYIWSTSFEQPLHDGWNTHPPGTYLMEYSLIISDKEG